MSKNVFFILSTILTLHFTTSQNITANVYYSKTTGKYSLKEGALDPQAAATVTYRKSYETTGWDFLAISSYTGTDNKYPDHIKAYAMGYAEGMLTSESIYLFYKTMVPYKYWDNNNQMTETSTKYLSANLEYMKYTSAQRKDTDVYWSHVYNIYMQMSGMIDAYNSIVEPSKQISYINFQLMNAMSDMDELDYWNNKKARPDFSKMTTKEFKTFIHEHTHCSSLIKVAPDFSDIWFGHNTWSGFNQMLRIFKEYKFISNTQSEKSKVVAFSGYPGTLSSTDDFFVLDNDLFVMETTNSVFNNTLYDNMTPNSLLSWIRTMLANRLSSTGDEWASVFARENSGTCNNQWQVLNLNLIDIENKQIQTGAFTVIEQIPGYVESQDMTHVLKKGYWPSFNSAYFPSIREISGYNKELEDDPSRKDTIDYFGCARANIFRREQTSVNDIESYKRIIRFNQWETDELSKGDPSLTIASRYDLKPDDSDKSCSGMVDAKFASIKDIKGKKEKIIHIINGPTSDDQIPFQWSTTKCMKPNLKRWTYEGHVDTYDFKWYEYKTLLFE